MLKFTILYGLKICERIMKNNLSMTLQKQSLSAAQAYDIAQLTIKTLQCMRSTVSFEQFFESIKIIRTKFNVEAPVLPRKRRTPIQFEVGEGEGYHTNDVGDYYHAQYFEAIDLGTAGIKNRSDQPGYAIYSHLEELLVKVGSQKDYTSDLEQVIIFYKDDF